MNSQFGGHCRKVIYLFFWQITSGQLAIDYPGWHSLNEKGFLNALAPRVVVDMAAMWLLALVIL